MEKGSIKRKKIALDRKLQETHKEGELCITKVTLASPRLSVKGVLYKSKFNTHQKGTTYLLSWSNDSPDPCSTSLVRFTISSFRARIVSFAFCSLS